MSASMSGGASGLERKSATRDRCRLQQAAGSKDSVILGSNVKNAERSHVAACCSNRRLVRPSTRPVELQRHYNDNPRLMTPNDRGCKLLPKSPRTRSATLRPTRVQRTRRAGIRNAHLNPVPILPAGSTHLLQPGVCSSSGAGKISSQTSLSATCSVPRSHCQRGSGRAVSSVHRSSHTITSPRRHQGHDVSRTCSTSGGVADS